MPDGSNVAIGDFPKLAAFIKTALMGAKVQDLYAAQVKGSPVETDLPTPEIQVQRNPLSSFTRSTGEEILSVFATIPGSQRLDTKGVQDALLTAMKGQLAGVMVKDEKNNTERPLASYFDFGNAPDKTHEQIVAEAQAAIKQVMDSNPDAFTPSLKDLLTNWRGYKDYTYQSSSVNAGENDTIVTRFYMDSDEQDKEKIGEKSPAGVVEENILARKEAILEGIKNVARGINQQHMAQPGAQPLFTEEDLGKLDLQVSNGRWGGDITVTVGSKADPAAAPVAGQPPKLLPTPLAKLAQEHLQHMVKDTILLTGEGADKVAHLLADTRDIEQILTDIAKAAPALAPALKPIIESDLFISWEKRKKRDENKPTPLSVIKPPENTLRPDTWQLNVTLPPGLTVPQVAAAMEGANKTVIVDQVRAAAIEAQKKDDRRQAVAISA